MNSTWRKIYQTALSALPPAGDADDFCSTEKAGDADIRSELHGIKNAYDMREYACLPAAPCTVVHSFEKQSEKCRQQLVPIEWRKIRHNQVCYLVCTHAMEFGYDGSCSQGVPQRRRLHTVSEGQQPKAAQSSISTLEAT